MNKRMIRLFLITVLLTTFWAHANTPKVTYPDPKRWTDTIREFEKWDSKNAYPKDSVLFVGSSSIVYWKTAEAFADLPVINRGFGGSYTADALYYVNELVIQYQPKVVIIYEGDNDIAGGIPPKTVHHDFLNLANTIHAALPRTEIICLTAKLCSSRWDRREQINELNAMNKAYAESKEYITFVDIATALLGADGLPEDDYFLSDRLHLNEKGYARWNTLMGPIIKERYLIATK